MVSTSLVLLPGSGQEVHRTPNTGNVSPSVHAEHTIHGASREGSRFRPFRAVLSSAGLYATRLRSGGGHRQNPAPVGQSAPRAKLHLGRCAPCGALTNGLAISRHQPLLLFAGFVEKFGASNTPKVEDNPPLPSVFNLFRKVSLCRHLVRQDDLLFPIPGTVRASSLSLPIYFSTFRSPISIYAARFSKCIYASLVGVKERGSPVVIHEEPLDEVMCPSRYSPYNMFSMLLALQAWCFFCFHFLVLLFWASMRTAVSCTAYLRI